MTTADQVLTDGAPEAPYEQLLDLVDRLASDPALPVNHDAERTLETIVIAAIADDSIDRELHLADTVRWLTAMVHGHRALRASHPDVDADTELALMRALITRWLHPARPDA
ncbi:hypothetical protein [Aeromicrobium sp. CF3.5]|uniref:hypothetical protein n=1 Tax=Aeromicrobium sp. CF3.5 TaxID=3373078 RepID=UPI003EE4C2F1